METVKTRNYCSATTRYTILMTSSRLSPDFSSAVLHCLLIFVLLQAAPRKNNSTQTMNTVAVPATATRTSLSGDIVEEEEDSTVVLWVAEGEDDGEVEGEASFMSRAKFVRCEHRQVVWVRLVEDTRQPSPDQLKEKNVYFRSANGICVVLVPKYIYLTVT